MESGGSALEQLQGYFKFCLEECPDHGTLCPLGALAVDFERSPDAVQSSARKLIAEMRAWLTRVIELGREQDEFQVDGDPEQTARMIMSTVQGARTLQRITGGDELQAVIDGWRKQLYITPRP